mgnify:FL=1|jgi:hypothetical protein
MSLDDVMISLYPDQVDEIICKQLRLFIKDMEENLDMIEAGRDDQILTIFDSDPVQEIAYIQDHIESAKMIIEWYGELADVSSGYNYIESVS